MHRRFAVLSLGTLAILAAACASAAPEDDRFEVVPLQFAEAQQVFQLLEHAQATEHCTVVPDPRTNSLLLRGRADELASLEDVIRKLDVEVH